MMLKDRLKRLGYNVNQASLKLHYFMLAGSVLLLMALIVILTEIFDYKILKEQKNHELQIATLRVMRSLNEILDTTARLELMAGQQIAQQNPHNLNDILKILKNTSQPANDSLALYSWVVFEWVNSQAQAVLNVRSGLLSGPVNVSNRGYIHETMRNPYKLIISPPIIGKTSGQKVLACSTGILDSTGKYMGTINAGVNINELAMKLTQLTATTNIKFHILNLKNEIFVSSIDTPPSIASFEKSPKPEVWRPSQKKGFMMIKPVRYKIPNYPLMVAAFYDDAYLLNTFLGIFIPHLLQFIGIFIIGFSLLLLFQKRYIKPIILLSLQAEELAKGRLTVNRLKQTNTSEIINLYKTLLQVKRYVAKNHRSQKNINKKNQELRVVNNLLIQKKQELEITQNDLQKAIRIAEESDNSKRRFIKQIKDELKAPLASILFVTEYLLEQVDDVDIQSYLNHIHQSATELKSLIRTQLCLEAINILELINESLVIHQKYAYKKQVEIKRDIQKDIPLFKADKLRFKQAIVGLLYRAIDNSPQGKPVSIACHLQQDSSQAPCLKIWITDAGFGLSAIAEQRIQSLLDTHSDDTELEIETIRRLIELHNGKLQIQRENGKGTHYVILLPLDVDKLALTPKNNVYSFVTNKTVN